MTDLIIVESPKKAKTISAMLGKNYIVKASVGHIRDLPERELGVAAPDYRPKYEPTKKGAQVIKELKELVKKANTIYLAADLDREGEAIAWHLQTVLGLKDNYHRIVYNEITETAVKNAIANPKKIDLKMVASQEARRVLDRLVGYRVSPFLKDKVGLSLPCGRVQSPAVKIIVQREKEINDFVSVKHYSVKADFKKEWFASLELELSNLIVKPEKYLIDKSKAESVINSTKKLKIKSINEKPNEIKPSSPFKTSLMQRAAFNKYSFSSDKTMKIAQSLYEKGLISYHRTDSINISDDAFQMVVEYANSNNLPVVSKKNTWKEKVDAQNAHEAIRPSSLTANIDELDNDEKLLYNLIFNRFVASQLENARTINKTILLNADSGFIFKATGSTLVYKGWKALLHGDDVEDEQEEEEAKLPLDLIEGQEFSVSDDFDLSLLDKKTTPPSRYSEATLTDALERLGIGRPSTYASIMNRIVHHGYIEQKGSGKKKYLHATQKAFLLFNSLESNFDFFNLDYTKNIEIELDKIASGEARYRDVLSILDGDIDKSMNNSKIEYAYNFNCEKCGSKLHRKYSLDKQKHWWGCSSYPDCKQTYRDENESPVFTSVSEKT